MKLYKNALPNGVLGSAHAVYAYDSVLALASALNATSRFEDGSIVSMPGDMEMLVEKLRNSRVNGVSVCM